MSAQRWMVLVLAVCAAVVLGGAAPGPLFLPMLARNLTADKTPVTAPSETPKPAATEGATPGATSAATPAPTATFTATPTRAPTLAPTATPSVTPSVTPTPTPTATKNPAGPMISIPAGTFQMGCDNGREGDCSADETPPHPVSLTAYAIDKYEVTNARYQACVAAGVCSLPSNLNSSTRTPYYGEQAYANYPVLYVTWAQAATLCAWEDSRLPTEAEWERAARGDGDTRIYPWGDADPTCDRVNGNVCNESIGDTAAVGSYMAGISPHGVMDMSGNVAEWVNDYYRADYYDVSPPSNPLGPAVGTEHLLRGGSWHSGKEPIRVAAREEAGNDVYRLLAGEVGFRCAR